MAGKANLYGTPWEIEVIDEDFFVVVADAFDTILVNDATTILYEPATPPVYEADILDIYFKSQTEPPVIDYENQRVIATVHDTANIEFLVPFITRSEHSCMYPKDEVITSFIEPIWYNITSFDDEIEKWWIVKVEGGYAGIDGLLLEDFKIFSNPATDKIEIKNPEFIMKNCTIELHDLNGKTLIEKQIATGQDKRQCPIKCVSRFLLYF